MIRAIGRSVPVVTSQMLGLLMVTAPGSLKAQDNSREIHTTAEGYVDEKPDAWTTIEEIGPVEGEGPLALTLDQAILLALRRNLTLAVQRFERSRFLARIRENRGIYDLAIDSALSTRSDTSPPSSLLEQADLLVEETDVANLSFSQLTPFGGTAQLSYNNLRFETTDLSRDPNPRFGIDFDFSFTQPLLRNFGRAVTERNLIVARNDAAVSREDFQLQVEDVLQQVITRYWDLVEAREQLKVAEESLALAQELDQMNRIQVTVGTMAALEVVQSEAGVAARREDIIQFQTQVGDAADALRSLIHLEHNGAWDVEIVPATEPAVSSHEEIDVEKAIETAYEHRPDLVRRRIQNESLAIDAAVARNLQRPRVDLTASYGYNAIDGDRLVKDDAGHMVLDDMGRPVRTPRGYGDALDQIASRDFVDWRVGVEIGFPLQNREARARSAEADLALRQGELERRDLELQARTEVRRAARALDAAAKRIEIAKISSELALRSLDAEQKRYENGLSTSIEVLRIQEDLSEARRREVSAVLSYRRAETVFYRSIGQLLERFGVVLADDVDGPGRASTPSGGSRTLSP